MAKTKKKGVQHRTTEQQLAEAEQRLNRLREQSRKEDTRRKVIVGSMIMSLAENDDKLLDFLKRKLDERLTQRDRRLFIDRFGIPVAGLYGKTLHPLEHLPGWAFSRTLSPAAIKP